MPPTVWRMASQAADRVEDVALRLVDAVVPRLEARRVLPVSEYHPFVRVGTDYFGDDVRGLPEHDEFEAVLTDVYEQRFGSDRPLGERQFPSKFLYSFLEAVITACSKSREPVSANSAATRACVQELLAALETNEIECCACRYVVHLTTESGDPISCGAVEVHPLGGPRDAESLIPQHLPRAWARVREFPFIYAPPASVVIARRQGEDQEQTGHAASLDIERFLLALWLLRGATSTSGYEFQGATTSIGPYDPVLLAEPRGFIGQHKRVAVISAADRAPISALTSLVDRAQKRRSDNLIEPLAMAVHKYRRSYLYGAWYEHLADLSTALEATLSGVAKQDVLLRLKSRAASLLALDDDTAEKIFHDLGVLYDLRSTVVHGSALSEKALRKKLDTLIPDPPDGMGSVGLQLDVAVDRLRDLVRRALVARMCLADGNEPLWPLSRDGGLNVDAVLVDDELRVAWRNAWHDRLTVLGAEEAGRPAEPAISWLHDDGH